MKMTKEEHTDKLNGIRRRMLCGLLLSVGSAIVCVTCIHTKHFTYATSFGFYALFTLVALNAENTERIAMIYNVNVK